MWVCMSNSYSLSRWQAIKAEPELEFCAADCRAGKRRVSRGNCNGAGVTLARIQKVGEGIFRLATAEAGRGGVGGWGWGKTEQMRDEAASDPSISYPAFCGGAGLTP